MNNAPEVQTHIGKFLFRSGPPFYIVLTRASHCEK